MASDLTVILQDRPGTLADKGEILGKVGINIEGMCGFPCEGKGVLHILVEDAAGARRVLEEAGQEVTNEREALVFEVEDRPGAFGEMARKIANAGANIDLAYLATRTRLVLGADDFKEGSIHALEPQV